MYKYSNKYRSNGVLNLNSFHLFLVNKISRWNFVGRFIDNFKIKKFILQSNYRRFNSRPKITTVIHKYSPSIG